MVNKIDQSQNREILNHYVNSGEIIAEMFAPYLEVIIHDLQTPEHSIIAIFNNHVTGRKIGDGTSNIGYKKDEIIGSMGFNFDLSSFANIKEFFEIFTKTVVLDDLPEREQFFMWSVRDELQQALNKYISINGLQGKVLKKEDKLKVVAFMKKEGHINKKGAISILSDLLAVTRPTLYKYIKEV